MDMKKIVEELRNHLSDPVYGEGGYRFDYLDEKDPAIVSLWGEDAGKVLVTQYGKEVVVLTFSDLEKNNL